MSAVLAPPARAPIPTPTWRLIEALPSPVLVVDRRLRVVSVNPAAETLFSISRQGLEGQALADLVPFDSPLLDLIARLRGGEHSISERNLMLAQTRGVATLVDAHLARIPDGDDEIVLVLQPGSVARQLDLTTAHRDSARSVGTLVATVAHEVKNPLAGIRGAAQLLEQAVGPDDVPLARLIRDETDRIRRLLDRMEVLADHGPLRRGPVNIHEVLEHVRMLAASSFARHLTIRESYDPSLPPVLGDRDKLVQVMLNLVRNAADAAPRTGGEISLRTHYQHGLRVALPGGAPLHVPITVTVSDNGPGVPEELADHLFDPFVSGKPKGTGLGLALVAKIVGEHGGGVDFANELRGASFRVRLPACPAG